MKYLFSIILIAIFSGTELVFAENDTNNVDTDTANLAKSEGQKGEGVEKHNEIAFKWFLKSATDFLIH